MQNHPHECEQALAELCAVLTGLSILQAQARRCPPGKPRICPLAANTALARTAFRGGESPGGEPARA